MIMILLGEIKWIITLIGSGKVTRSTTSANIASPGGILAGYLLPTFCLIKQPFLPSVQPTITSSKGPSKTPFRLFPCCSGSAYQLLARGAPFQLSRHLSPPACF